MSEIYTKFYINDGFIYGPRHSGKFYIEDNVIYGPKEKTLPWLEA